MSEHTAFTATSFQPSEQDIKNLMDWFATYDGLAQQNNFEAMADAALLPITVISDDSQGDCVAQQWDRETFKQSLAMATGGTDTTTLQIENHRQPTFLSKDLAVVITDSVFTIHGQAQHMRYTDIMAKQDGEWKFKCMVQTGWGDMLK